MLVTMSLEQSRPLQARNTCASSSSFKPIQGAILAPSSTLYLVLPPEILLEILKSAITDIQQGHGANTTLAAFAAQAVQRFLLSASLVHRTWTAVAQELLLRNAYVTLKNYRHFLFTLRDCSSELIEGIHFIRFGGETRWETDPRARATVDQEEVERTTRMVKRVIGVLSGLKEVELTGMAIWELDWLPEDGRIAHARFVDSAPLLRSAHKRSRRSLTSPTSRYSFTATNPDPTYVSWHLDHSIYFFVQACKSITSLSLTNLGGSFSIGAVCRVGWGRSPSCSTIEDLTISGNYTSAGRLGVTHHGSPWAPLISLKKLTVPLSAFPSDPYSSNPLPPTIQALHITPEAGPNLRFSRLTGKTEEAVADWYLPKARQVLLLTVKSLPRLEEVRVEEILQGEELVMECRRMGIWLRSAIKA
ncbi:hypothetical protein BCR35DRAFT_324952 [Leucosporidium creatinivorum]|uniref:F-box domain-containing protein n=1 Tax=Leucosporidium creatinivorum TaxID=106004 RepID=A0A1Y2FJN1_9BASI|nr:hypothetical protein BCR35DRAFT_324952 [Leucosporidium creatinivorum]